jgi:hypothetical protein
LVEVTSSSCRLSSLLSFLLPLMLTSDRELAVGFGTTSLVSRLNHSSHETRPLSGEEDKTFPPRGRAMLRVKSFFVEQTSALTTPLLITRRHNASTKTLQAATTPGRARRKDRNPPR